MVTDRDKFHGTYAEWLASAKRGELELLARGQPVERVVVDPDELAGWCLVRGRAPNSAARAEFVADKVHRTAQQRR